MVRLERLNIGNFIRLGPTKPILSCKNSQIVGFDLVLQIKRLR